jgi:hypothetical protein
VREGLEDDEASVVSAAKEGAVQDAGAAEENVAAVRAATFVAGVLCCAALFAGVGGLQVAVGGVGLGLIAASG